MSEPLDAALSYAREHREQYLQSLCELLRIPSVSTQPQHAADVRRASEWLAAYLRTAGFPHVERFSTTGHPIVYAEHLAAGPDAPTALIYGHYDVQPADSDGRWLSDPFVPEVRDQNLYARGVSDDKGQLFTALAAAHACLAANNALPLNLKFLLEGEEEQAGNNIVRFIEQHAQTLAADFAFVADYALVDEQTPAIIYGFRGIVSAEVSVTGPETDLHSGVLGGAVDNPFNVLIWLLSQLKDSQSRRIRIPGFYNRVRRVDRRERQRIAASPTQAFTRAQAVGVPRLAGEDGYTVAEWVTIRPTLDIHGIRGGYVGPGHQTVIPSSASAKLSMRLVEDQDPHEIARALQAYLHALAPPTVRLDIDISEMAPSVALDVEAPAFQAAATAFERSFGAKPVFMRSGGTLPVIAALKENLDLPIVVTGFGLPDDNWHAPNEKLRLSHFYRGIEMLLHLFFLARNQPPR